MTDPTDGTFGDLAGTYDDLAGTFAEACNDICNKLIGLVEKVAELLRVKIIQKPCMIIIPDQLNDYLHVAFKKWIDDSKKKERLLPHFIKNI